MCQEISFVLEPQCLLLLHRGGGGGEKLFSLDGAVVVLWWCETVLVPIIHLERVANLLSASSSAAAVRRSGCAVEVGELVEVDGAVAVLVNLRRGLFDLFRRSPVDAKGFEDRSKLGDGDFSVTVRVELVEYLLHFVHVT
ncbi:hypothetical protein Vadar_001804 [Vaccinium darrowii]|uniref:Uncharacterized protein n=1 Tax=Vaccinium darrowii TaxID=229202 RepID=A0ACB7YJR0_9ERIC|nr:hypothetical protein Vadar_001804 [Vaccinium darrowii]